MRSLPISLPLALLLGLGACAGRGSAGRGEATIVAESDRQWTGVAVARDGRIFVNYPRWSEEHVRSVAVLEPGGERSFPNAAWNSWTPETSADKDPARHFVCVQSVHFDDSGALWVLDPANPRFAGVVPGGPKLVKFDAERGEVLRIYRFGPEIAPAESYLNDVRIDVRRGFAYLSESGTGALIGLDLTSGRSRRVLAQHTSTKAEAIEIAIEGRRWKRNGETPQVHCDGIALSPDREFVYFQALTGRTLYRIPSRALRDFDMPEREVEQLVERLGESPVVDGILFGADGHLYLSALEKNAVLRRRPDGTIERIFQDRRLAWPDSFAKGPGGTVYVTTAQIHRAPEDREPFRIWRLQP